MADRPPDRSTGMIRSNVALQPEPLLMTCSIDSPPPQMGEDTEAVLGEVLAKDRLARLRAALTNEAVVQYRTRWFDEAEIEKDSIDLVCSQAVLERALETDPRGMRARHLHTERSQLAGKELRDMTRAGREEFVARYRCLGAHASGPRAGRGMQARASTRRSQRVRMR